MPASATTVCVVVHWNNAPDTLACLAALALQTAPLTTVVVDNGSTDDSPAQVARFLQQHPNMHFLQTGENRGFSAGNNAGIRWAQSLHPAFFWLLNNDTVPPPDTLAQLLTAAEQSTNIGLTGSVLLYAHAPTRIQAWGGGHIFPNTAFSTHFTSPHTFGTDDYLTFASVLVRNAVFQQIGLLDEHFFMYFEDADFCLRAQRAGWGMTVAAGTAILHREGASAPAQSAQKDSTVTASGLRLIALHGRSPRLGSAVFVTRRILRRILSGQLRLAAAVVVTALRHRSLPSPTPK